MFRVVYVLVLSLFAASQAQAGRDTAVTYDVNTDAKTQDHGVQIIVNYAQETEDTLDALWNRVRAMEEDVDRLKSGEFASKL